MMHAGAAECGGHPTHRQRTAETGATGAGVKAVSQATHEVCTAAALLGLGALTLWVADEQLYHLGRCLVASVALSSGYAQTARRNAKGACIWSQQHACVWLLPGCMIALGHSMISR